MPYVSDRIFSKIYENDFLLKLNSIQPDDNSELVEGNVKEYDIIHNGQKYEIKSDRWTYKTKNVCIEFLYKNNPSGISTTTSEYWVYYVVNPNNKDVLYEYYYEIPVIYIKDLIEKSKYKKKQNMGDGFKSSCYLFDQSLFIQFKKN
jgi:hypothetical protein